MPNLFARQTSLTDVAGRIDYIGNPLRQEHLLAFYDTASDLLNGQYWQILAKESQASFEQYGTKTRMVKSKTGELIEQTLQCSEAREIFFLLGNELLEKKSRDEILKTACDAVSEKIGRPVTGALHFNKSTSSLHVHIIYADRELLQEPVIKVAERNLFFDAEGKRRYKKAEILDENKQLLPGCRIVRKGEIYESRCFGSVDDQMLSKDWLKDLKTDCILKLRNGDLKGDVEITEYDPSTGMLPQQYIGNRVGDEVAEKIAEYNDFVREYNQWVLDGKVGYEAAMKIQRYVKEARDRNYELGFQVEAIRKFLQEETKKTALDSLVGSAERRQPVGPYWQKYRSIRDETWEIFIKGQRKEFQAIRACQDARRNLIRQNSHVVIDGSGKISGYKLNGPAALKQAGYFEARDKIKGDLKQHKNQLALMKKYQEVAKGRQTIIRALLLAGAEKDVLDAAVRNYEESMNLLQRYTEDPTFDIDNRRLKVAQESLGRARARAERYIKKLEEESLKEESALEIQADQEYQAFKNGADPSSGGATAPELQEKQKEEPER